MPGVHNLVNLTAGNSVLRIKFSGGGRLKTAFATQIKTLSTGGYAREKS